MKGHVDIHQFDNAQVDDEVERIVGESHMMYLKITEINDETIFCGAWTFDRETGLEIDEELGWTKYQSGTRIIPKSSEKP